MPQMGKLLVILDLDQHTFAMADSVADALKRLMEQTGIKIVHLAERSGISRRTIHRHLSGKLVPNIDQREAYAKAFGVTFGDFQREVEKSSPKKDHSKLPEIMPDGIDPRRRAKLNPTFYIDVVASTWADVPIASYDTENPEHRQILEDGRFQLRIIGDCMEPPYPNGSTVQCRLIRSDLEIMPIERAYVFCRTDGTATFKALVRTHGHGDEAEFELAAINQDRYPRTFRILCSEIGRIAKVEGVVLDPAWTLKIRE